MTDKPMLLTLERQPITNAELTEGSRISITGEIGQVGVLIPEDSHAFRQYVNQEHRLILQLPGHGPYYVTIEDINGGRFRIDENAQNKVRQVYNSPN